MEEQISFIPLGGVGDVTRNMYLYETKDSILIVDCGIGFADETMIGVDLLLPDVSYLQKTNKKIAGMVLTHGHEDHIGALPFILPLLPDFPIFGTPLTAALANEKLKEFAVPRRVQTALFEGNEIEIGRFKVLFVRVTHSVPDSANILIKTPAGNFYHASDFKFDLTPVDGKKTEFQKINEAAKSGIICLMSDCLGAEKKGHTPPEIALSESFETEMSSCKGKFLLTTYSSNISRLNQAIEVARHLGRKVCFVGRSLIKAKEIAEKLGYMKLGPGLEITIEQIKNYEDKKLLLLVAGSQGQENSAMTRIANGEHKEVKLTKDDVVVFSADPIPGNEVSVNSLIDTIAKRGTEVVYSGIADDFHVSGHAFSDDLSLMMSLVNSKKLLPIGGTFRQMVAYKKLAQKLGYLESDIFLIEDGQEIIFSKNRVQYGRKIDVKNIFLDEVTGGEVENFILRDRQKLSEGGIVVVLTEVDSSNGQIVNTPDIVVRGLGFDENFKRKLIGDLKKVLGTKKGRVTNWVHLRKQIGEISENLIYKSLHRRPLVLPVVIEV